MTDSREPLTGGAGRIEEVRRLRALIRRAVEGSRRYAANTYDEAPVVENHCMFCASEIVGEHVEHVDCPWPEMVAVRSGSWGPPVVAEPVDGERPSSPGVISQGPYCSRCGAEISCPSCGAGIGT